MFHWGQLWRHEKVARFFIVIITTRFARFFCSRRQTAYSGSLIRRRSVGRARYRIMSLACLIQLRRFPVNFRQPGYTGRRGVSWRCLLYSTKRFGPHGPVCEYHETFPCQYGCLPDIRGYLTTVPVNACTPVSYITLGRLPEPDMECVPRVFV